MRTKQLIIKVTTDYNHLINMLTKYSDFLNNLMNERGKPSVYLEMIESGLLLIFSSIEDARKYHDQINLDSENISTVKNTIQDPYLKEIFLPLETFPEKGFTATISPYPTSFTKTFIKILKKTYERQMPQAAQFIIDKENNIKVRISSVEVLNGFFSHVLKHYFLRTKAKNLKPLLIA